MKGKRRADGRGGRRASPRRIAVWRQEHPRGLWYLGTGTLAVVLYAVAAPVEAVAYASPVLIALLATAARCLAIVGAVRFPLPSVFVFACAALLPRVLAVPGSGPWPWTATTMIGFAGLVITVWAIHGWRLGVASYVVPGAAISALTPFAFDGRSLASSIVAISVGAVAAGVGALLAERVRIGEELTKQRRTTREETDRRVVMEERQRIARELHDVVAHGLSLIQVQAMSARYRLPAIDQAAAGEFDDIAGAARSSLAEMRRLLGALRGDEESAEHAPQPGLEDIPSLIDDARRAGAEVGLAFEAEPDVPGAVGIAAFRIVQEGISNAMRHAPGERIAVAVGRADGLLRITVTNALPAGAPAREGRPGHGLVGMRERAALLGGSLEAGRTVTGTFRVAASLPLAGGVASSALSEDVE